MSEARPLFRTMPALKATFFLDEEKRHDGGPLALAVLDAARTAGVRTALVAKGIAGFGRRRVIQTSDVELLQSHLPVTVECIDDPDRVERLLERLEPLLREVLVDVQATALLRRS